MERDDILSAASRMERNKVHRVSGALVWYILSFWYFTSLL